METIDHTVSRKDSPEVFPPLFHCIKSNVVSGFDNVDYSGDSNHLYQPTSSVPTIGSSTLTSAKVNPSFRHFSVKYLIYIILLSEPIILITILK